MIYTFGRYYRHSGHKYHTGFLLEFVVDGKGNFNRRMLK